MNGILESNRTKMITTPNGSYSCIIDLDSEVCNLYRNQEKNLLFVKALQGQGVFLNNTTLLMFFNSSGYGYCEGDSYLFFLNSDELFPLYYGSFEELSSSIKWSGGYHISFSSNILVTNSFLIMKDEFGGIYFYKKDEILKKKNLQFFFCLPCNDDNKIDKLYSFNDETHVLKYSNYNEGYIREQSIDFNQSALIVKSGISLQLKGVFYTGFSMDYHTISSKLNDNGKFDTLRTKLGEAIYQLKYNGKKSEITEIAETASSFLKSKFHNIDLIIPIPPSDLNREFQPVFEIGNEISKLTQIPIDNTYIKKSAQIIPIKEVDDNEKRKELLRNAFSVIDKRYEGKTIILFDDLYRSGETLNAAAKLLKEQGKVGDIYVLTITKTRTNK